MPIITFNAFSFLKKRIENKGIECTNAAMKIEPGTTAGGIIQLVKLKPEEVEVVFINGKVAALDTVIRDNDRVALVPPGTPGPYRVLLGFKNKEK